MSCPCNQANHCGEFLTTMARVVETARTSAGDVHVGQVHGQHCDCDMRKTCGPVAWSVLHQWAQAVHDDICPVCGEEAIRLASFMHDYVNLKTGKPLFDAANFERMCGEISELEAAQTGTLLAEISGALATFGQHAFSGGSHGTSHGPSTHQAARAASCGAACGRSLVAR